MKQPHTTFWERNNFNERNLRGLKKGKVTFIKKSPATNMMTKKKGHQQRLNKFDDQAATI